MVGSCHQWFNVVVSGSRQSAMLACYASQIGMLWAQYAQLGTIYIPII